MSIERYPDRAGHPMYRDHHPSGALAAPAPYAAARPGSDGAPPMSGFAVSAFVWGVVGLVTLGLGALGGVICGPIGLRETRLGARRGHRLAVVGLSLSWLQIAAWLVVGLVLLVMTLLRAANL